MVRKHDNGLELELMTRVQGSDMEALKEIYELYKDEMFGFFFRLGRDHHLAEDALQELFFRIWKARDRYRPTAAVRTFLYTIARNLWLNQAEKRRGSPVKASIEIIDSSGESLERKELADGAPSPAEQAQRRETMDKLLAAMRELPSEQRVAFVMAHYQGMRYAEIARIMDVPVGTVKSRIANAAARLRRVFDEERRRSASGEAGRPAGRMGNAGRSEGVP